MPVWRLQDPGRAGDAIASAKDANVGLVFYRGNPTDGKDLKATGFREIEILVTFESRLAGKVPANELPDGVRIATPEDVPCVADIASTVFKTSRWHADPSIPNSIADEFKRQWAVNDLNGRGVVTLVAVNSDGRVVGFNALLARGEELVIDLIGVAISAQGQGHGTRLVEAARQFGAGRFSHLKVGTQASNKASCQLYSTLGMSEVGRQTTWHWTPDTHKLG